jgi:hypothetical protein
MGTPVIPGYCLSIYVCRMFCVGVSPAEAAKPKLFQDPVYSFYPVLNENRWLWQFLHSVLMLLSFCFLLPLGSLLARHKWIFGRDPLSVRLNVHGTAPCGSPPAGFIHYGVQSGSYLQCCTPPC